MWLIQRGNGRDIDNGLDREHVDVVDYDDVAQMSARDRPAHDTNKDKTSTKPTTRTLQQVQLERKATTAMTPIAVTKWAKQRSHAGTTKNEEIQQRQQHQQQQ